MEAVRNLYHDQSFADRILALSPSEQQMDVMLRNRFTVAKLGWQPRWFSPDLEKWLGFVRDVFVDPGRGLRGQRPQQVYRAVEFEFDVFCHEGVSRGADCSQQALRPANGCWRG